MKKHKLSGDEYRDNLETTRKPGLIEIISYHPQSIDGVRQVLGFLRFKYDKNTLEGWIEISNYGSKLQAWHLSFGGTSKEVDPTQSGQHGEGLKLEVLVFRRYPYNHAVSIEASGCNWSFAFNKHRKLICTTTRVNQDKIRREKIAASGKPRSTQTQVWSDVTVTIGKSKQSRDQDEQKSQTRKIALQDFEELMKVMLDLNDPKSVRTPSGDLVLGDEYANKLYLRGLHLRSSSSWGRKYKYGYNFADGYTNRERQAVGAPGQAFDVPHRVNTIWANLLRNPQNKDEFIGVYTGLILQHLEEFADVTLRPGNRLLDRDIAEMVFAHMRTINADDQGRPAFYHAADIGKDVCTR
jgi:hypothetical protein